MLGKAAVAMWWDIASEVRAEWEDWHTREHMPERLGIPGFLRGTRWIAESGQPSYFVLYEAERLETLTTGTYLERLNHPTPWSLKMMPHHRNMVRSLCEVRATWGGGVPQTLATIRFSLASDLPKLPQTQGLTGAHLLQSVPMAATPQTMEQKIRGGDASADWVLLIGGYDSEAVKAAVAALPSGMTALFYRPAFSLMPKDVAP
jgi:hypothetical protein